MILEPKHKKFTGPLQVKVTVKKRFNIRRYISIPGAFKCYYFKIILNWWHSPLKCYSGIAITLRYIFALSHSDLTLLRSVIAAIIYRFGHIGAVIASYSYCSKLIYQHYCFCSLLLSCYYLSAFNFSNSIDFSFFLQNLLLIR